MKVASIARIRSTSLAALLISVVAATASAATLTGTVTNRTTDKPAVGVEVSLLELSQGMSEAGTTRTDAQGRFTFEIANENSMHLVRANHAGVNYFSKGGPLSPGTTSADIDVYDSAARVDGIRTSIQAMRIQSSGDSLDVTELYAVQNASNPPQAVMSDRTYTIYLPEGAEIQQASASGPGGMPISAQPAPGQEQSQYYFSFPLRPGETRFQVAYRLPYKGDATIRPRPADSLEHFAVLLPSSMQFQGLNSGIYSPMPSQDGASSVQVATGVKPGQDIAFRVSGTGVISEPSQQAQSGEPRGPLPGGGIGKPEGTPDPLHEYRWGILAGLAVLLGVGGVYTAKRSPRSVPVSTAATARPVKNASRQQVFLEGLKEELFQLEMDRQQGRVTPEEYAKSKAALDETLHRAASRKS